MSPGAERKASIEGHLRKLCEASGVRLVMENIDIMVGGSSHNLLSRKIQDNFIARVEAGEIAVCRVGTSDNVADICTKPMPSDRHRQLAARMRRGERSPGMAALAVATDC